MIKLERTDLSSKVEGLTQGLKVYALASGKEAGQALQKQAPKFLAFTSRQFRLLAPSKEDISLQALSAQKRRGSKKGSGAKNVLASSSTDLASGMVLGLKIRPSVTAEARVKFGQASAFGGSASFKKRAGKARDFYGKHAGAKTKKVSQKRTVKRDGKDLGISAWMVAREIAVRRSGRTYLAYGFSFRKLRNTGEPTDKTVLKKNKFGKFASKLESKYGDLESSIRLVDAVPGTVTVDQRRGIIRTGVNQVRADMTAYLARKAVENQRRISSGRSLK